MLEFHPRATIKKGQFIFLSLDIYRNMCSTILQNRLHYQPYIHHAKTVPLLFKTFYNYLDAMFWNSPAQYACRKKSEKLCLSLFGGQKSRERKRVDLGQTADTGRSHCSLGLPAS